MKSFFLLVLMLCLGLFWPCSPALAESKVSFKVMNPDGRKFEFMRSYLSALSYLKSIDMRWDKRSPKKLHKGNEIAIIQTSLQYLVKDNGDLRIAKNYMEKYLNAPNPLMRKVADLVVVSTKNEIEINNKEKSLWEDWLELKRYMKATPDKERIFVRRQAAYAQMRKDNDKLMIEASVLAGKVVMSQYNDDERGRLLAITKSERTQLLEKLNSFAKNDLDWGLKPGQRTVIASIAVIREVLEDPIWITAHDSTQ